LPLEAPLARFAVLVLSTKQTVQLHKSRSLDVDEEKPGQDEINLEAKEAAD
jgi:hypothetical protein